MKTTDLLKIIESEPNKVKLLIETLDQLKAGLGFQQDLLTPGFIKEWMISEILGHKCHTTKHGADAYSQCGKEQYEYLSCKEGGGFQLDRIHDGNLIRITRNSAFFFAEFDVKSGLICQRIWKGSTQVFLNEALRKLEKMSASSNHLTFPVKWVKHNCELVYLNPDII